MNTSNHDLVAHAQALLDTNSYLTLVTADPDGQPWISPVCFASAGDRSSTGSPLPIHGTHSISLAARSSVSSSLTPRSSRTTAVPCVRSATRASCPGATWAGATLDRSDLDRGELHSWLETYPGPSPRGAAPITRGGVSGASRYRLYRATASDLWVRCPREPAQPCALHGLAHRERFGQRMNQFPRR